MNAELIDYMGDDIRVVDAARVSFNKESSYDYLDWDEDEYGSYVKPSLKEKDQKLIKYLAKHNHFTPFTHCTITMRETVPIFVARQRFKHTVGFTYNEVSRRYVDEEPEFYTPDVWRERPDGSIKQGSGDTLPTENQKQAKFAINKVHEVTLQMYNSLLALNVAPEQARMVLPQSMYTSYYVTGSLSAWARAYNLRSDSNAQVEIQMLAKQWDSIIKPLFPESWKALTQNE